MRAELVFFKASFRGVEQNFVEGIVLEKIKDGFPLSFRKDYSAVLERAELMGKRGLIHSENLGEVVYADLRNRKSREYPEPRGIGKNVEKSASLQAVAVSGR